MKCMLIACCTVLIGCRSGSTYGPELTRDPVDRVVVYDIDPANSTDPGSVLASLSHETLREIESIGATVELPERMPFNGRDELRRRYCEWYRKGFAVAFVTRMRHQRPHYFLNPDMTEAYRAKCAGWYDGNAAGAASLLRKDLLEGFRRTR